MFVLFCAFVRCIVGVSAVYQETACANAGGSCMSTAQYCSGTFLTGYCPTQPTSIKCCVAQSVATGPAYCEYSKSRNTVSCWDNNSKNCASPHKCATCATDANVRGNGKLPAGSYRIGPLYDHKTERGIFIPWFDLYRKGNAGGYWDFNSEVPDINCRGGFGLHVGPGSTGCIAVIPSSCFAQIQAALVGSREISFSAAVCNGCAAPICKGGVGSKSISYIGDLLVTD